MKLRQTRGIPQSFETLCNNRVVLISEHNDDSGYPDYCEIYVAQGAYDRALMCISEVLVQHGWDPLQVTFADSPQSPLRTVEVLNCYTPLRCAGAPPPTYHVCKHEVMCALLLEDDQLVWVCSGHLFSYPTPRTHQDIERYLRPASSWPI